MTEPLIEPERWERAVQLLPRPELELDVLEELDFEPSIPCALTEWHKNYSVPPDDPASLIIRMRCSGCGYTQLKPACWPCVDRLKRTPPDVVGQCTNRLCVAETPLCELAEVIGEIRA